MAASHAAGYMRPRAFLDVDLIVRKLASVKVHPNVVNPQEEVRMVVLALRKEVGFQPVARLMNQRRLLGVWRVARAQAHRQVTKVGLFRIQEPF